MENTNNLQIVVAIRLAHASWRDFLGGFLALIRAYPQWSLRIAEPQAVPKLLDDGHVDGLVIGDLDEQIASRLRASTVPTVVVGSQATSISSRKKNIVFLHNDDEEIGRVGATVLMSLGSCDSYGFVHNSDSSHWSELRARGFADELKKAGRAVTCFTYENPEDGQRDDAGLREWIESLPKPAAIMAACDAEAVKVIRQCQTVRSEVPEKIAVLGVDNDRLLCESVRPALSSIAPDHAYEGELAAKALSEMLRRASAHPRTILCDRKNAVMRESTKPTKTVAALMRRAREFINERATSKITAADVAKHLGVSRQLLDMRFAEFGGMSPAETIRNVRLQEVRRQIRASARLPIHTIAANCGWTNFNHLENAFKRHFGISMRDYRNGFEPTVPARAKVPGKIVRKVLVKNNGNGVL